MVNLAIKSALAFVGIALTIAAIIVVWVGFDTDVKVWVVRSLMISITLQGLVVAVWRILETSSGEEHSHLHTLFIGGSLFASLSGMALILGDVVDWDSFRYFATVVLILSSIEDIGFVLSGIFHRYSQKGSTQRATRARPAPAQP